MTNHTRLTERVFARLYERIGSRIILVVIAGAALIALCGGIVAAALEIRYLNLHVSHVIGWFASVIAVVMLAATGGLVTCLSLIRTLLAWRGDGATPEQAVDVWLAIVDLPKLFIRTAVGGYVIIPPIAVLTNIRFHSPWYGVFVLTINGLLAAIGALVPAIFSAELALRPMLREVSDHLPPEFDPPVAGLRLRAKALLPVPIVTLFAAVIVGAWANVTTNGTLRFGLALGVGFMTVLVATVIFLIASRSALAPIDDLLAATRRVRAGDVSTPVPIVTTDELAELSHSFNQMLIGLHERETLQSELQASRARIAAAADEERRRVERDLHDGAQQQLVLLGLKLGVLSRTLESDPPAATAIVRELRADLDRAQTELRDLAHGIYPLSLESDGLPGALREAVNQAPLAATLSCDSAGRYAPELEAAVYFCCLEALQNAAKHAGEGAHATVSLAEHDGRLTFEVADDGPGFDVRNANSGAGLQNMTDRIGALGGELRVESSPGAGTTVIGTLRPVR